MDGTSGTALGFHGRWKVYIRIPCAHDEPYCPHSRESGKTRREATARKMETVRLVVWAPHGIYVAGQDLDETFGLIETAEKVAEIYMKIAHLSWKNTITDEQMHQLEEHFGVKAREGYLR